MSRGDKQQRRKAGMRERGVRVSPLPKHMHRAFVSFIQDCRIHAQSHYGTWRQAIRYDSSSSVHANAIYWRSVIKYLNTLEYLGTHGYEPDTTPPAAGPDDGTGD